MTGKSSNHIESISSLSALGNITVGGTGKTPFVAWLVQNLCQKHKCAILTRGYKATAKGSDEANIIARACPNVPVIINPDRLSGARDAVKLHSAEVLIMDDGFQHRRLARDIDIVTIDSTCPFGYGKMLPAGLLREPVDSVKRADAAILTPTDQTDSAILEKIEKKILALNPSIVIAHSIHKPIIVITSEGIRLEPERLYGKQIFAFCGTGNPNAFYNTIRNLGAEITGTKTYDDHYNYRKEDIATIAALVQQKDAELAVTSEKDFSKIEPKWLKAGKADFAYLAVGIEITKGVEKITELIETAPAGKIVPNTKT